MASLVSQGYVVLPPSSSFIADVSNLRHTSPCAKLDRHWSTLQAVSGRLKRHRRGGGSKGPSPSSTPYSSDPSSASPLLPSSRGTPSHGQASGQMPVSSVPAAGANVKKGAAEAAATVTMTLAAGSAHDDFDAYRGLVLDTAYRPINVINWKRALCLDILAKADVLEYYDQVVKSTSMAFPIPAVLRVSSFIHSPMEKRVKLSLSRNNIFLRDKFKCQYCGCMERLTIDHVKAVSRGGGWTWDNLVTACAECNLKKGDKTAAEAGMKLAKQPREPREIDSHALPPNYGTYKSISRPALTPQEWVDWLPIRSSGSTPPSP